MTLPALAEALQATWPAATVTQHGQWLLRDGAGAGRRASAASPLGEVTATDVIEAETAMRAMPMAPLFAVRSDQPELEAILAARGYRDHDHSVYYACAIDPDIAQLPHATAFHMWPPLAIMEDIWRAHDVAQPRIDLMHRATCAKAAILGRTRDRAAGVGFVGAHNGYALIHALVVAPEFRRAGLGRHITTEAMIWAASQGCHTMALAVTRTNTGARALYASLGMEPVGEYHYRSLPE